MSIFAASLVRALDHSIRWFSVFGRGFRYLVAVGVMRAMLVGYLVAAGLRLCQKVRKINSCSA